MLVATDLVARLLYSRKHYSTQRNQPKPVAFDPSPYSELSTVHVTGLSDVEIWDVAVKALSDQRGRQTIYARADVPVKQLHEQDLRAVRDDDPFIRHTLVLGWPELEDPAQRKERWVEICLALSQGEGVTLVMPPEPVTRR